MSVWNSELYLKFKKERTQPSCDLANAIKIENPANIIDIGCGPGNSTAVLKQKFPNAHIIGADFSQNMIEKAKTEHPDLEFIRFDASKDFANLNQKFDVVFSNACIQWIPNHKKLLPDMMNVLKPAGMLAVQIPVQFDQPIHKAVAEVAALPKWKALVPFEKVFNILAENEYFDILSQISSDFKMWKTVYMHRMPSQQSIIEWYRSTGLKPYLDILPAEKHAEFENDILEVIKPFYPVQQNGEVIFRFPRLFFVAVN